MILGVAPSVLLGDPHLPNQLWAEAFKAGVYTETFPSTGVLDGKTPLEVLEDIPIGRIKHMHERECLAFKNTLKHVEGKENLPNKPSKRTW